MTYREEQSIGGKDCRLSRRTFADLSRLEKRALCCILRRRHDDADGTGSSSSKEWDKYSAAFRFSNDTCKAHDLRISNLFIMFLRTLFSSYTLLIVVQGLSSSGWRAQSIYQVMTDRFARTDGSTTASCDLSDYCGGTWQGLIKHLDYIQNMGFTAVSMRVSNANKY